MKIKIVKRQGCGCEAYPFCEHASNAISPTGRLGVPQAPPLQNIPAPRTQLGNEIREALRAHKHDAEFFKHAPRAPLDPQYAYCCMCQNYLLVPCPDCGGDCETLLAALKTSLAGGAR